MGSPHDKTVAVTWSGGVDSTAVLGKLLQQGYIVIPVAMQMGPRLFRDNELRARQVLSNHFAERYPSQWNETVEINADWLTMFSSDGGKEILRRNKHILDYVMMNYVIPRDLYYVATGSHLGSYPPAVDHLPGGDTDSREMIAYLLQEYGIGYQLISLLDFGESRYKTDRLYQLWEAVPESVMFEAYNCLGGVAKGAHCGECYKCVERRAAFDLRFGEGFDQTKYIARPHDSHMYEGYIGHFKGVSPKFNWQDVRLPGQGSHQAGEGS